MTIAIIGASGFLGQHIIRQLLHTTEYDLRAFCRSAESLHFDQPARVELIAGDIADAVALETALAGADAAIYLIHKMGTPGDFAAEEAKAAELFAKVALKAKVPRVIYMSGLGSDADHLSKHLASRHKTGEILRSKLPLVIELRASMIVAPGSVSYDIIRSLAIKLPALFVPRWTITKTQPIGLEDALNYIQAAITLPVNQHQIVEIGGPKQFTYKELVAEYAAHIGRRPWVVVMPFVPRKAAIWWLNRYVPGKMAGVGGPMVDSLLNSMIVTNDSAAKLFPAIHPAPIQQSYDDDELI